MKKLSLVLMMVFAVSWAMAQNTATISQNGGAGNTAFAKQNWNGNNLVIDQQIYNSSLGTNVAGVSLLDPIKQDGSNNAAKLTQITNNITHWNSSNFAKIQQIGDGNQLVRANVDAKSIDVNANAEQVANKYSNTLNVVQNGKDNRIGVYQHADGGNNVGATNAVWGDVSQEGSNNWLIISQQEGIYGNANHLDAGSVQSGDNNVARIYQYAYDGANTVSLIQKDGNNWLVDADANGLIVSGAATQTTTGYAVSNDLEITQSGGSNKAGLHQESNGANNATFSQIFGSNTASAFQTTVNGQNDFTVSQNGGDFLKLTQTGSGNNMANITQ